MDELIEFVVPGGWGLALGVGVGAVLLMRRSFRPLAKGAIKGYLVATEGAQRAAASAKEGFEDLYSEAKAEREAEPQPQSTDIGPATV